MKLNKLQKAVISDQFSNDQEATDQELIEFFAEQGIDEAVSIMLIEAERPMFLTDPAYEIDWSEYERKTIVMHKPIKDIFEEETGISASAIKEILHAFPCSYGVTIHTSDRTFHGWLNYHGKLKKGSLQEEK